MVLITSQFFSQYKIQETYLQNPLVFFSVQNTRNISTKPTSFFLSTKYKKHIYKTTQFFSQYKIQASKFR